MVMDTNLKNKIKINGVYKEKKEIKKRIRDG
jgi:hypothetical protein